MSNNNSIKRNKELNTNRSTSSSLCCSILTSFAIICGLGLSLTSAAQSKSKKKPDIPSFIKIEANPCISGDSFGINRTRIIPYNNRDFSLTFNPAKSDSYAELSWRALSDAVYECEIDLSLLQMDREVYLNFDGVNSPFDLYVNGQLAGTSLRKHGKAEILIDPYTQQGYNQLILKLKSDCPKVAKIGASFEPYAFPQHSYIVWQPLVHLEDYIMKARMDSIKDNIGILKLDMAIANNFNAESGPMQIWFELEDMNGRLVDYSYAEMNFEPMSRDTARFDRRIANIKPWSHDNPQLYRLIMKTRQQGNFTEYSSRLIGFRNVSLDNNGLVVNNKKIDEIRALNIPSEAYYEWSDDQLSDSMKMFKAMGINTLITDHPMQMSFYTLADKLGFYVSQSTDLNTTINQENRSDLRVGDPNNDIEYLPHHLSAVERIYREHRNTTCIVAWSLGNGNSNGYNNQKAYQLFKSLDPDRAVWYAPAYGEWNSDLDHDVFGSKSLESAREIWKPKTVSKKRTSRRR